MIKSAAVAAGSIVLGLVFALVMALVIFGGGGSATATTPGFRGDAVPEQYRQWVLKAGAMCPEIGPVLIAAQIDHESKWNPEAVSNKGAAGLSQFMPGTWPSWSQDDDGNGRVSPFDPGDAIMAQGRFMCALVDMVKGYVRDGRAKGEILDLALAAYNAGPGGVLRAGGIPTNGQTEIYVPEIKNLMAKYTSITAPTGGTLGARVVAAGSTQLGKPYVWGGGTHNGPTGGGFDCSGLVMYALYQASGGKIKLAIHLADWQVTQGAPVAGPARGAAIDLAQLQVGDIIGFADAPGARYHHIGIYAGNGQLLHAPETGDVVKIAPLATSYWAKQVWNVRRFG